MADNTEIIAKIRGDASDYKKSLEDSQAYTKLWADLLNKAELDVTQKTIKAGEERIAARRAQQKKEVEDFRKARNEEYSIARSIRQKEDAFYQGRGPDNKGRGGGDNAGGKGAMGLTSLSYFVDDLQSGAGFRGIANNIGPMLQSFGATANAAAGVAILAAEVNFLVTTMGPLYKAEWDALTVAQQATKNWDAQAVAQYKVAEAARTQSDVAAKIVTATKAEVEASKQIEAQLKRQLSARDAVSKEETRQIGIRRETEKADIETADLTNVEKVKKQLELKQKYRAEDYAKGLDDVKKRKALVEQASADAATEIRLLTEQANAERARAARAQVDAKAVSSTLGDAGKSKGRQFENEARDATIKAAGMEARVAEIKKRKAELDNQYDAVQAAEVEARNKLRTLDQEQANDAKRAGAEIDRIQKENLAKTKANIRGIADASTAGATDVANAAAEQTKKDDEKAKVNAAAREQIILEMRIQSLREQGRAKQADALDREIRMKQEVNRLEKLGFDAAQARDLAKQQVDRELGKQRGIRTSNPRNTTGIDSVTFGGLLTRDALQTGNGPRGNLARNPSAPGAMDDMVKSNNTAAARRSAERNSVKFDSFGQKAPGAAKPGENAVVAAINILTNVVKQGQNPTAPLKRS